MSIIEHEFEDKSPMEDYLFILMLSLTVSVWFLAKQQQAERFALPVRGENGTAVVSQDEYRDIPVCELPKLSPGASPFQIANRDFESVKQLVTYLQQQPSLLPTEKRILLRVHRSRSVGDEDDIKQALFELGMNEVLIEKEQTK